MIRSNMFIKKLLLPKSFLYHILICTAICSAIYLPTVLSTYQKHDDYEFQEFEPVDNCRNSYEYAGRVSMGRILLAEVARCAFYPLYHKNQDINFFSYLRLLSLISVALTCGLFSYWISTVCQINRLPATLMGVLIFTLPGSQFFIAQAITANNSISLILIAFCMLLLNDHKVTGCFRKDFKISPSILLCIILLLITWFNYQTNVIFLLIPPAIVLLLGQNYTKKQKQIITLRYLALFTVSCFIYIIINKFIVIPMYFKHYPNWTFTKEVGISIETNISILLKRTLFSLSNPRAVNLWIIDSSKIPGYIFLSFIGMTGLTFFIEKTIKAWKEKTLPRKMFDYFQTTALLFIIYLGVQSPQIANGTRDVFPLFRVIFAQSSFLVMCLIACIYYWAPIFYKKNTQKLFVAILVILTWIAGALAQQNTLRDFAYLSMAEINYLESEIEPLLDKKVSTVYIRRPIINPHIGGDEFSMFTSFHKNDYGVKAMIKRIYMKNRKDSSDINFKNIAQGSIVKVTNKTLEKQGVKSGHFIDLNKLLKIYATGYYRDVRQKQISGEKDYTKALKIDLFDAYTQQ